MVKYRSIILIICIASFLGVNAQSTYRLVQQGNKELDKENFSEAEVLYRKALDLDGALTIGQFNIGNAKYLQEDYEAAIEKFNKSAEDFSSKKDKAGAFHNIGNAYLSQEKYEESIEAYKNALKLVPNDMDTKYNLAYAQLKLREQQEQEQQEQESEEEQEENEEENEEEDQEDSQEKDDQGEEEESDDGDEEESDEGEEEESDENGEEKDDEGKEDENGEPDESDEEKSGEENEEAEQERPENANDGQLSQEEAEQILNMLQSEEGKLQEKLEEDEKGDPVKVIFQKDW